MTYETLAATCAQVARYFRGLPGPRPKTPEAAWLADRLDEGAAALTVLAKKDGSATG